jgi:hypothetical protein
MFPLPGKSFPADAETLRAALEESLRKVVTPAGPMVTVEEKSYPELAAIRLSLDGATASDRLPPRPAPPAGKAEPALRVQYFEMSARPVHVQGAAIDLSCRAREVEIGQARDAEGKVLLLLQNAAEGTVEISIPVPELETLVRTGATAAARKQGVILEDVRLQLLTRSERALDAAVQLRARKLFLNAAIRINASLEIDDRLNARLTGLECAGEGTLGTLACGFLGPQLQRLNNRDFSLLALPLGEMRLRDVQIAVGDELRVTTKLGGSETIRD